MNKKFLMGIVAVIVAASAIPAQAQVRITEVAAWGSGNSPYLTDWFELTNIGATAINITGWKMDDNSNSFAVSAALTGITNIAAGESVIFTENPATASFLSTWFGGSPPVGLQIGNYTGGSVGLSTAGDAVNIYNSAGVLQANVSFGASPTGPVFATFDNAVGVNGASISTLSVAGTNGAFVAANDAFEIGSPGSIASTVALVPEPETYALMLAGLGFIGAVARKRQQR